VARNERRTLPYRLLACAVLAAAACAAPGVAQAHGGPTYLAGEVSGPAPTIDGVVTQQEWDDSDVAGLAFGSLGNSTLRFVHTPTHLYIAAVVQDPAPGPAPAFNVLFDDDHDGAKDQGEDAWLSFVGGGGEDFFYSDVGTDAEGHYNDVGDGTGTNDTVAAGTISGSGDVMIEQRHPLCSADTSHDICVSPGQTLGINFQYQRESLVFANAPGPSPFDPSSWADLTLVAGDVVWPTVDVTAPAAGSLLRGTVNLAADASDNVGVDRVEFRYFGGAAVGEVPISTDTEAPYTATFDSTQVPNSLRGGGTVYAVAYDTAGHSTAVGNAVMVDNPPSRIVFETDRDGNSEIYIMEPNGNDGITRLTNDPVPPLPGAVADTGPSMSPDGSLIAWQRGGDIWLMNSDGTEQRALTTDGRSGAPAFSPDGTRIAFHRDPAGDASMNHDIWVMNADGTGQTRLTSGPGNNLGPTWSPDGTKLAFDSDRSGSRDIFTMNADGTSQANLAWNSPQIDSDPDWSPDGQKLLFVSGRGGGGTVVSVWSANADGSGSALNVTNASIFDADPAWSPDGTRVVFTRDSGGQTFNLHLAQADGTTVFPTRITFANTTQRNSFPDWVAPAAAPAEETVTLEPVADTYVRASDATTPHGTETTFDVHAGASTYCGEGPGPAYGLLRFDLSSLPAGVRVSDARLELTVAGGFAYDGDPAHYAIRLYDNGWGESVTWDARPADGILPGPEGPPFGEPTINGVALSSSADLLGKGNAFNNNCEANSGGPPVRTFTAPETRPDSFARAVGDATGDGSLSVQIWSQACGTPTTVVCQNGQLNQAYFLRYYSREAEPALRPKLVVTYAPGVEVTSFSAAPTDPTAGLAQVDINDVPPSVLLAPPRGTTDSTPLGETPPPTRRSPRAPSRT
jgi:TolB protein